MWHILMRKTLFDQNDKFFVDLRKNASKQQKMLVQLYVAYFNGKYTFLT